MPVTIRHDGPIAIVTINNPPVNAVSQAVRKGLLNAQKQCEDDPRVTAVVLACAGRTFVAGADISEFNKPPVSPHLPDVITSIERSRKPWVAALHGSALGGGLEIAMGCHARIAAVGTKLGLPEVTLGLIPGAGGTVRLPRLVSADRALEMIAGGKPITAQAALEAGLVDALADADVTDAAIAFAKTLEQPTPTIDRPVRVSANASTFEASAQTRIQKARGQRSVEAAVVAVETALSQPADVALKAERVAFLTLKSSDQSAALRHVFFAERATLSDPRCKGQALPVQTIGVVGGGTMGAGIAAACLLRGLTVHMVERDDAAAAAGAARVQATLAQCLKRGILNETTHAEAEARFSASATYGDFSQADLLIEAVFEDMDVKHAVFAQLDKVARPDAILATNTSYLDVNAIAAGTTDPSRVIGLHFFSPAHVMKLLEIVVPDGVADEVVATAAALSKRLGKIGILSGVCDGFIANRIMSAYRQEADFLIEDGAQPWDVDAAMRDFGFPIGVFEMQDLAGLDIAWAMRKRRAATRDPAMRYVSIADRLCEAGRFGRKTDMGWYDYAAGGRQPSQIVTQIIEDERGRNDIQPRSFSSEEIMTRILAAMQREGAAVLSEGIARSEGDIDVTMINGYGFPRWRGGPMYMKRGG